MLFDTHSHIYMSKNPQELIKNAIEKSVNKIALINLNNSTLPVIQQLCKEFPENCIPTIGLHPNNLNKNYKKEFTKIEQWLNKHKFYAIGEIGIDLYRNPEYKNEQIQAFKLQLNWAEQHNLPVIIHERKAFDLIYDILSCRNTKYKGIFHCFSGTREQAQKIIDLGFHLGINGIVTFKKSKLAGVLKRIDLKHIVLETDAPFLAPEPKRGKRNQSAYLIYIADFLAKIYNLSFKQLAQITTSNAYKIFNLT